MPFIGKQSSGHSKIKKSRFTATASQTAFSVVSSAGDELQVFLNGVLLKETDDYTYTTSTVTLGTGASVNDIVEVHVYQSFTIADTVDIDGDIMTGELTVPTVKLSSNVIKASDGGSTITLDDSDNVTIAGTITSPIIQTDSIKDDSGTRILASDSGSVWSWGAGVPEGTVLQIKHDTLTGTLSTDNASYQDIISLSITTRVASSKILAIAQTNGAMNGDVSHIHYRVYNTTTSTEVGVGDDASSRQGASAIINNTTTGQQDHVTTVGQDSPAQNAGTTITYKLQYHSNGGTEVYINRSNRDNDGATYDGRGFSSLTLMEIAP